MQGQEKRTIIDNIRVERIEILESRSRNESQQCIVYNLQVSGHPSYYAEGFLVHNCHYLKSSTAKRTKAAKQIAKSIPHIIALSGTPIINRPIEIYNAIKMIDSSVIPSWPYFTRRFCGAFYNGFGWNYNGATNTEELNDLLLATCMIRRKKADVLKDLPPKTRTLLPIEIDNRKEYDRAENDFIAWVRKNKGADAARRAKSAEVLTKIETLKQLAVKGKLKLVISWIEDFLEIENKLVIFAVHKTTINVLMEKFKDFAVKLDGSSNQNQRQDAVDRFQNDPKIKLFIGNIQAAGVGISLFSAHHVCFIELPWTSSGIVQAEDRIHRIGQENKVIAYYLLAQETIEEKIMKLLETKSKILDQVLDGKTREESSIFNDLIKSF